MPSQVWLGRLFFLHYVIFWIKSAGIGAVTCVHVLPWFLVCSIVLTNSERTKAFLL